MDHIPLVISTPTGEISIHSTAQPKLSRVSTQLRHTTNFGTSTSAAYHFLLSFFFLSYYLVSLDNSPIWTVLF